MPDRTTSYLHHARLVPSLAALVGGRAPARGAFTLIEMMIAVALSTVILITAVAAFRTASRAISMANAMSNENSLLRIGFQASIEDVDFFHSEADDKAPYVKGFTRMKTKRVNDASTPDTDQYARRHFQPLRFMSSTDPDALPFDDQSTPTLPAYTEAWTNIVNPNVMQAHDPRSIDRGFIFGNTTPNSGNYRYCKPTIVQGDYRLVACTDMRFRADQLNPLFPYATAGTPASYQLDRDFKTSPPWPDTTGVPDMDLPASIQNPVKTGYNQAIPLLGWQIFSRLSLVGFSEYLSPGVNMFVQDQNGDPPNDNWQWGGTRFTSPKGYPENYGNQTSMPSIWWRSYATGTRDIANYLGCDFHEGATWSVIVMPVLPAPPGSDYGYDRGSCILQMIMEGATAGTGTARYWMGWSGSQDTGDVARNDTTYTSRTVRLPYNRTDGERSVFTAASWTNDNGRLTPHYQPLPLDYDKKPSKYPVLTTSILRYRRLGGMGAVTVVTSTIEDQVTGRRVELTCTPYGTTYRGARQHWRLYSPAYAANDSIGDFYDDAAGPFYAP